MSAVWTAIFALTLMALPAPTVLLIIGCVNKRFRLRPKFSGIALGVTALLMFVSLVGTVVTSDGNEEDVEVVVQETTLDESTAGRDETAESLTISAPESTIETDNSASEIDKTESSGATATLAQSTSTGANSSEAGSVTGTLEVHFIDVGQGDSALIMCNGENMLIDAGDNSKGTTVQNYLQKIGVTELKYCVGTHPDADHIGGLDVVITKFTIASGEVWMPEVSASTATYRDVIDAIEYKSYKKVMPATGAEYSLGGATITILGPLYEYEDDNDNSIVIKVTFGDKTLLFMGDAESSSEEALTNRWDLKADVIKIGHHGSRTSTSEAFIKEVDPEYAIISCGEGNSYGHPTAECLNRLRTMGVKVYRTDEQGTIVLLCDGTNLTFNCSPSETWIAGEATGSNSQQNTNAASSSTAKYVLNTKTMKIHYPDCNSVGQIKAENYAESNLSFEELIAQGYSACGNCDPH